MTQAGCMEEQKGDAMLRGPRGETKPTTVVHTPQHLLWSPRCTYAAPCDELETQVKEDQRSTQLPRT
ncbi:hypothetical protein MHYP_G00096500 [Metynnis hypsauchen]